MPRRTKAARRKALHAWVTERAAAGVHRRVRVRLRLARFVPHPVLLKHARAIEHAIRRMGAALRSFTREMIHAWSSSRLRMREMGRGAR